MRLRVTTPTSVVMDDEVTYVQAEDPGGRFGILPGHEPLVTAVAPSIVIYWQAAGEGIREGYVAINHGVLRVAEDEVQIAVREAVAGDDLARLRDQVREARRQRSARAHRSVRSLYQMQITAWRRLVEYEDERSRS